MNIAIIAAGGRGKRFQSAVPKQLLQLKGRPVLSWTLRAFQRESRIDVILLTYPQDDPETLQRYQELIDQEKTGKVRLVCGGDERYDSVRNAFQSIDAASDSDLVLIHDAARPLLSGTLLRRLLDAGAAKKAVIPALPVSETLKETDHQKIIRTVPRQQMYLAQTPQVFQYGVLKKAYDAVQPAQEITDEAMLVEKAGVEVWIVPGDRQNVKITEPADLQLAEYYLGQGGCE